VCAAGGGSFISSHLMSSIPPPAELADPDEICGLVSTRYETKSVAYDGDVSGLLP
jgi:hypothetical protein